MIFRFIKKCMQYGYGTIFNYINRINYIIIKDEIKVKHILSIDETIETIITQKVSVSRFGDGEFKWMLGVSHASFEETSLVLSRRLIEVLQSHEDGHIVCISPAFAGLDYNRCEGRRYWEIMLGKYGKKIFRYLDINRTYYNANITRFYMNNVQRDKTALRFEKIKLIWDRRNVLLVEGEFSRLGVGNDLLDNAASVRRILAPAKNAFECYHTIFAAIKAEFHNGDLVLCALGPTATILAYDCAKEGMQTIDIGHIDIEYEWFLHKSNKKIAIPGKAVNEAVDDRHAEKFSSHEWEKYLNQIVRRIY